MTGIRFQADWSLWCSNHTSLPHLLWPTKPTYSPAERADHWQAAASTGVPGPGRLGNGALHPLGNQPFLRASTPEYSSITPKSPGLGQAAPLQPDATPTSHRSAAASAYSPSPLLPGGLSV